MKKTNSNNGLRPEYDFASMKGGVRAKYAKRYREGTNIVLLEPDIAEASRTMQQSTKPFAASSTRPAQCEAREDLQKKPAKSSVALADRSEPRRLSA